MIASIHQPNYIPWVGYFDKIFKSDVHIFLDDVQYSKNGFINRNKILMNNKEIFLTIPVYKKFHHSNINEVVVEDRWKTKHLKSLKQAYSKTKYFSHYIDNLEEILYNTNKMGEINSRIIQFIAAALKFETEFLFSSTLPKKDATPTGRLIEILENVSADVYLSGLGAKSYIDETEFSQIELKWQHFIHPVYNQNSKTFIKNLSILDLLFNEGENSRRFFNDV